jgi:hypothetical protein
MKVLVSWAAVAAACIACSSIATAIGPLATSSNASGLGRAGPVPGAASSWCHGTAGGRGSCTAIYKRHGKFLLVWATTETSVKHYKICAESPKGKRRCLKRNTESLGADDSVGELLWFARNFPHNLSGRYAITWRVYGEQLGPALHFNLH